MLGRKRISYLETKVANLKEIIADKNNKITSLEGNIESLKITMANYNTCLHEIIRYKIKISDLEVENEKLQSKVDELESNKNHIETENFINEAIIEGLIEILKGVSEIKTPKEDKWHKEYQKVMRKLEKITGKNKPF